MKRDGLIKAGDIIVCDRIIYQHYGVYDGNDRVIHYATKDGDFGTDVRVRETSLEKFARDGNCMILPPLEGFAAIKPFSPKETVRRAHSRLGEKEYHLLFNNCEHFALWCKYGVNRSVQVEEAMAAALILGAAAAVTYIAVESDKEG